MSTNELKHDLADVSDSNVEEINELSGAMLKIISNMEDENEEENK